MTLDEITRFVRANVDNVVIIRYQTGEADTGLVLTVDDEGFVYDLVSPNPQDRETSYWAAFSEVAEVQSASARDSGDK